jgi:hypothetical protein
MKQNVSQFAFILKINLVVAAFMPSLKLILLLLEKKIRSLRISVPFMSLEDFSSFDMPLKFHFTDPKGPQLLYSQRRNPPLQLSLW